MSGANLVPLGKSRAVQHSVASARDKKLLGLLSSMRESDNLIGNGGDRSKKSNISEDSDSGEESRKANKSKKHKKHKKHRKHDRHEDGEEDKKKKKHKKHKRSKQNASDSEGEATTGFQHPVFESDFRIPAHAQDRDPSAKDLDEEKPPQVFSAPAWAQAKGGQSSIEVDGQALKTMEKVQRLPTNMSDTMCKLTGVEKPIDAPAAAASEEKRTFTCYRCGREGHTTTRCKETYSKAGKRLMKGHR
eukprot:m.1544329 g.1544329  ORF g.1544329 m.1544329 type:complete len:246 (+) comp25258_c0_seq3:8185-8922(+)